MTKNGWKAVEAVPSRDAVLMALLEILQMQGVRVTRESPPAQFLPQCNPKGRWNWVVEYEKVKPALEL